MKISILTLFPEMFVGPFDHSIIKRAKEKGLVEIELINIRDFATDKHQMVDDSPYGGGVGMVMKVDVVHRAILHAKSSVILERSDNAAIESHKEDPISRSRSFQDDNKKTKVVLMTASGKPFKQAVAKEFAALDHLILICGHYEGIDDRIKHFIDEEVSIGDFVLTGGELATMVITDAVTRLLPGAITDGATEDESFSLGDDHPLLEYPHYTKPQVYEGFAVPEILLSGNHPKVAMWRHEQALEKTKRVRPDLTKK